MSRNKMKARKHLPCDETPDNCNFLQKDYRVGEIFCDRDKEKNYLMYCREGKVHLTGSLFREETLQGRETLFLPRMADCRGEIEEDTRLVIHTFNNTVCRMEECILSYLYTHKRQAAHAEQPHCCKLSAHRVIDTFMESICHYLTDGTGDLSLWHLKHKELIQLLCRYFEKETLQQFFHPMTGESVPFKSLVLSHYQKANDTGELAELCGYGVANFRRVFKEEFGIPVQQWLIKKRAEHIRYRLSFAHISFADIIEEFNFSSPAHFSNFCKQFLGDTPSNLRRILSPKDASDS